MPEETVMVERNAIYEQRKKGLEGERIFREYCKEHGIKLSSPFNSCPRLVLDDDHDHVLDRYELTKGGKLKAFKRREDGKHVELCSEPPAIQDYHYKIMNDRGLLSEKDMGSIDYCSFENMSLYEVKDWKKRPSLSSLTSAQKEVMRRCIGKWRCFLVWVKGNKEIELIEIEEATNKEEPKFSPEAAKVLRKAARTADQRIKEMDQRK